MTEANTLLQQAESQCHTRGVRFTPIRRRVLELIAENGGGLKAYDLLDQLSTEHAAARPPTVYRALEFLIEQGLVHRITKCLCGLRMPRARPWLPATYLSPVRLRRRAAP